jgi:type IV fimbrial biogenesis protein FimT
MHMKMAGFSLVEALIAIAIVAILFALALPSFHSMLQSIQVKTAAEALNNGMQLAKAEAVRRNANVVFTLGSGTAWTVGCATPIADSNADGVDECPATIQSRENEISSANVTLSVAPAGATTVSFSGLGRVLSAANPITSLEVGATATNKRLRILISGGSIRMCDPNIVSNENARKC